MNVLIIDDQPDVVEGIRLGIDWNFLAVSHIFHAYNSEGHAHDTGSSLF